MKQKIVHLLQGAKSLYGMRVDGFNRKKIQNLEKKKFFHLVLFHLTF